MVFDPPFGFPDPDDFDSPRQRIACNPAQRLGVRAKRCEP